MKTDRLTEECAEVKVVTAGLKTQITVHGTRLTEIEVKIEQLERKRRRTTLVIDGVKEKENEDIAATVGEIFTDVGVDYNTTVCVNLYRRGRKQSADRRGPGADNVQPRPIIVVFLRRTKKAQFFGKLKNLQGNDAWRDVYFNDDLTEIQEIERRDLKSLVALAKKIGKEAKIKTGAFWYEGRRYGYEELHRLPPEISLLKAKTLNILDNSAIIFQSPHSPLSNLYPCNLVFRDECFLSAEGAWQYHRALVSGFEKEAEVIKAERNPYKAKKLGGYLRASQEWDNVCEDLMRDILLVKFSTVDFCKNFLIETGMKRLYEGTGDRKWGCGIPISKYWLVKTPCPGRNLLGMMLENTREQVKLR